MGMPNLVSRMPVVVFSWVWASTLGESRTSTGWVAPASAAMPSRRGTSSRLSMTMRPTPASRARRELVGGLVVAVEVDSGDVDGGGAEHGDLAAGGGVEAVALGGDEAREGAVEEGLGGVDGLAVGVLGAEGVEEGARLGADGGVVVRVERSAVLAGERGEVAAAHGEGAAWGEGGADREERGRAAASPSLSWPRWVPALPLCRRLGPCAAPSMSLDGRAGGDATRSDLLWGLWHGRGTGAMSVRGAGYVRRGA